MSDGKTKTQDETSGASKLSGGPQNLAVDTDKLKMTEKTLSVNPTKDSLNLNLKESTEPAKKHSNGGNGGCCDKTGK